MSAAHTPGPWFAQYDDNGFYEIGSEASSLRLAFTYGEGETDEANARLIAAAPELLAALKLYVLQDEFATDYGYGVGGEAKKTAEAAIAKATGGAA